jgi:ketosteroid isomerase-like protein
MLRRFLLALFLAACLPTAARAGTDLPTPKETDAIVLKFQTAYADAFDHRDAKALSALLTENATLQNEWGDVTQGRAKIEALVTNLMSHLPAGVTLEDTALVSQSVAPGVIVSQGISHRIAPDAKPVPMFFTRVLVRVDGEWKLAATEIARPSTVPKPTAPSPAK